MAKAKKDKKLVVNQAYFELIERKSKLLDTMFDGAEAGTIVVNVSALKDYDKIAKDWDKVEAGEFEGTEEPYEEPAE